MPINPGGTVSGVNGTLVLRNAGGDDLAINADGPFAFATPMHDGDTYAVHVSQERRCWQPLGRVLRIAVRFAAYGWEWTDRIDMFYRTWRHQSPFMTHKQYRPRCRLGGESMTERGAVRSSHRTLRLPMGLRVDRAPALVEGALPFSRAHLK